MGIGAAYLVIAARMGVMAAHLHKMLTKARQRAAERPKTPAAD